VKTIKVRRHPRGMCFSPDGKFAYVACMGGQALAKFEVANDHQLIGYVPAGTTPRHAVITKRGHRIYVSNNLTGRVSKVDVGAQQVIASCKVGRQARTIALSPDERLLAVCNNEDNSLSLVNTHTMTEALRALAECGIQSLVLEGGPEALAGATPAPRTARRIMPRRRYGR
jgi:DNA-binding beta-propeller fold protein YncE